ncbi:hypothetical protein LWF15_14815 [Kineosporia rhizophila]|uniref:hypothetical protein n=1 Tax=Kineosporia TaxID=49184 RepID=UPI001E40349B|nr:MULTISPECIES: hypothetical protein [Kineosporia]MCE0536777.1 hypothetical protein [Kineosporia rhizophila]GLY13074.1 hypothetical protein Kisp01_00900 [Kineosporia sp. NBRC 101677]
MNLRRKLSLLASSALLVPVALATGAAGASAAGASDAAEACSSYPHPATGNFRPSANPVSTPEVREFYPWNYLMPAEGVYEVCLDGAAGTNYDIELLYWDSTVRDYVVVAASRGAGSTERLSYTAVGDNLAQFRVRVVAVEGYGAYTVAVRMPQDG